MARLRALLALFTIGTVGACSVEQVTFSAPGATPDASSDAPPDSSPMLREVCETPGDEDGNGKADCQDTACVAGAATCTATAACNTDCSISRCGDGKLNLAAREEADPPTSPTARVPVNPMTCRYDFALINQLFCFATCGVWGGGDGCQQADANAFCRLKTGNPASTAVSFTIGQATAAPGICCPNEDPVELGCVVIGKLPGRVVALDIYIHESDLLSTHGPGEVIRNVTCTNP
jgi:hypothetical protein